ncbi:MAG: response regulator [Gammaproteobacteria bacterium SHHR-1]|uniref:response regulator n=1 Tax=Magnetovirga frankeli TaxID=947516 RepID=UPI001293A45D|nr:response regulator [gamma proteobacterium SS-5]
MTDSPLIHCVDDDEINRLTLMDMLEGFRCLPLENGRQCLEAAQREAPALILLDVMMPEMDGLETCRQLRLMPELSDVPVIFASARSTLDDRMEGYSAGADDYLTKPLAAAEVLAKVNAALNRRRQVEEVRHSAHSAETTVSQMVTMMGEMGTVVSFFQGSFACHSYASLARRIIQAHEQLGLEIAMEMRVDDEQMHFSTTGVDIPLERSVFEFVRNRGRLIERAQRAAVNYPHFSLIVRNMPLHDEALSGRIRDYIAQIAQGADAKIRSLRSELLLRRQQQDLLELLGQLQEAVGQIDQAYQEQKTLSEDIFDDLLEDLEESFLSLGLTDQQEASQRHIVEAAQRQTGAIFQQGLALEENFSSIVKRIRQALEQVEQARPDTEEDEDDSWDANDSDGIELF